MKLETENPLTLLCTSLHPYVPQETFPTKYNVSVGQSPQAGAGRSEVLEPGGRGFESWLHCKLKECAKL